MGSNGNPVKHRERNRRYYAANRDTKREQLRVASAAYKEKNPAKVKEQRRLYVRGLRIAAIAAYGGKCACCSEDVLEFLCIDHSFKNGAEERANLGEGTRFYLWLKRNDYPDDRGYRVLCHNCNAAIGHYGVCPHQMKGVTSG